MQEIKIILSKWTLSYIINYFGNQIEEWTLEIYSKSIFYNPILRTGSVQVNDPSRYAMMNQGQQTINKQQQQQQQFQNQMLQQQQQQQRVPQSRQSQANYVIQPPKHNQKPQQQRPLPSYIPSTQIQKIIGEFYTFFKKYFSERRFARSSL